MAALYLQKKNVPDCGQNTLNNSGMNKQHGENLELYSWLEGEGGAQFLSQTFPISSTDSLNAFTSVTLDKWF